MEVQNLRERRDQLFQEIHTILDLQRQSLVRLADDLTLSIGGFALRPEYCDGRQLFSAWTFDGSADVEFPAHVHSCSMELVGLASPGLVEVNAQTCEKTLCRPGDLAYSECGVEHILRWRAAGGSCSGWMLHVPPDPDAIPRSSAGDCLIRSLGHCTKVGLEEAGCCLLRDGSHVQRFRAA